MQWLFIIKFYASYMAYSKENNDVKHDWLDVALNSGACVLEKEKAPLLATDAIAFRRPIVDVLTLVTHRDIDDSSSSLRRNRLS